MTEFDAVKSAREELLPNLRALIETAEADGEPEVSAFFVRILKQIEAAQEEADLADPFMELSTSAFRGFSMSFGVTLLLDEILDHSARISEVLARDPNELQ
ncbi:MAG: hypothetical protein VX252_13575 [Myxococcota bacterium]|nr:hypothetical protein [Myxococcota bacterium]